MSQSSLADHLRKHIATRQQTAGVTLQQKDQFDAAALDGADLFDSFSEVVLQSGGFLCSPVASRRLIEQLARQHGDPLKDLHACRHLRGTPAQPGFIHGAAPERVFCKACFKSFLLTEVGVMIRYEASHTCDACRAESRDFRPVFASNGIVNYIVNICMNCAHRYS